MGLPFDVVCFAGKNWTSHRQRSHWVADVLATQGAHVVFVENLGTRMPRLDEAAVVAGKVGGWARTSTAPRPRRVERKVTVDSPLVLPLQHLRIIRSLSAYSLARRMRRRVGGERPLVVWTYLPMPVIRDVAGRLGAAALVYDWADDAAAHVRTRNEAHRLRIAGWENEMAGAADVAFFSSAELLRRRGEVARNPVLVPHGVQRRRAGSRVPALLADLPRPRVGFVGSITEFTDLALIAELARSRPAWSFVLVGPAGVRVDELRSLPNVLMTGKVAHDDVLDLLPGLDAAVVPYRITPAIEVASPLKIHEYLDSGLPVVSVDIPEVRGHGPDVELASGPQEFLAALDRAVARGRRTTEGPPRSSWEDRVGEMVAHVLPLVDGPGRARRAEGLS